MANSLGVTHYTPCKGGFTIFSTDTCEVCGCVVEAPNAVTALEPEHVLSRGLKLKRVEKRLGDLYYCEALGVCTCEACYVEEPDLMEHFEDIAYRWINVLLYGAQEDLDELRQEVSLSHGPDVAYLAYCAALILLRR